MAHPQQHPGKHHFALWEQLEFFTFSMMVFMATSTRAAKNVESFLYTQWD